ncbi:MAG: HIT domain-containing protein [Gemmataceae bacterium]|nr:HIT domain-containing protein [Gemmataceae bacterium]
MEQLWAPWRMSYIAKAATGEAEPCFICAGDASSNDRESLVAHRTKLSIVVLNRFPYNNGHLLVAPRSHKGKLEELTSDELLDTLETVRRMVSSLQEIMKPDGFNIGLNLGRPAGAGLPGHLHWHIVPRWVGDTNFMPVLGDVKVISQSLESLWELLTQQLNRSTDSASAGGPSGEARNL